MRVIIAGSRTLTDPEQVRLAIANAPFWISEIITGACPTGADYFAGCYAQAHNIPLRLCYAQWDLHGRAAGPIRNREMAAAGDALIAVWDGGSRGTASMIQEARKRGIPVYIHLY